MITRSRRFGKTLNLDMIEHFFSVKYDGRSDLFQNLSIWQEKTCRNTAQEALARIERMKYTASLETKRIPQERI